MVNTRCGLHSSLVFIRSSRTFRSARQSSLGCAFRVVFFPCARLLLDTSSAVTPATLRGRSFRHDILEAGHVRGGISVREEVQRLRRTWHSREDAPTRSWLRAASSGTVTAMCALSYAPRSVQKRLAISCAFPILRGVGCGASRFSGYRGTIALNEGTPCLESCGVLFLILGFLLGFAAVCLDCSHLVLGVVRLFL